MADNVLNEFRRKEESDGAEHLNDEKGLKDLC